MGQKVNPIGLRVAVDKDWRSRWFSEKRNFGPMLVEDLRIRELVKKRLETRQGGYSDADWNIYKKLKSGAQKPKRIHYSADTSRDITPVIDRLMRDIEK